MFLRNCWYVAASAAEFDDGRTVARRILNQPILMFRTSDGRHVAFEDRCPHRFVPLSAGQRVGDAIQCGYHGLVFGSDGVCILIPGQVTVPKNAKVSTYPLEARYGYIWIWLGSAAANPDLIPLVPWAKCDGWAAADGYTHVTADYRLLTDNLLDLSHENYIHSASIGNEAEETISRYPVKVTTEDGILVRAHREMPNILPPPFFKLMRGTNDRIDRWQTAIWTAPSINMTDVGARSAGAPKSTANISHVLHLLTPETETSTHYFWSQCRSSRIDDVALTEALREAVRRTFDEDKLMLEMQQKQLSEGAGEVPGVAIKLDDAPLRARRLLAALIKREAAGEVVVGIARALINDEGVKVASPQQAGA